MSADTAPRADVKPDPAHDNRLPADQKSRRRRYLLPALLVVGLIAAAGSTGFASWYYASALRPDIETTDESARRVVKAASEGAVALLSYTPEHLSSELDNAKSRVTDKYLIYYQQFAEGVLGITAMRGHVTSTATVIKAAVAELHPASATVLVFLMCKTSSAEKPVPVVTSSKITVSLKKAQGTWLIDDLQSL